MSDTIALRDIRAYGKHGADPGERNFVQPFDIDLELELDLAAARTSDRLEDTLDYAALHALVVGIVRERSYALLERLGHEVATEILRDGRVKWVAVTIAKPALLAGATPAVRVSAQRSHGAR